MFFANSNYGHASILRQYSGWKGPIPAVIPHGISFEPRKVHQSEIIGLPVLSWPPVRDAAYSRVAPVIPSAAPFLYALELAKPDTSQRKGTLFFPAHSTAACPTEVDWYDLARSLKDLPQPVTVCLHWHDAKHARDFEKRGYEVVCAGGLRDEDFVFNLIGFLSKAELAAGNDVSSPAYYAVASGIPFVIHGERPVLRMPPEFEWSAEEVAAFAEQERLFATPDFATQEPIVLETLGKARFKTPEQLFADLQSCPARR